MLTSDYSIVAMIITDGRKDCFTRMWESFKQRVRGWELLVVVDDSADSDYGRWVQATVPEAAILHNYKRSGFAGAIQAGWHTILPSAAWIFHVEDDFVFLRDVNLMDMKRVLLTNPLLAQMALVRQPVADAEVKAGGVIEQWPGSYTEMSEAGFPYLIHSLFFTTNPSLYHRMITVDGWPQGAQSERIFTEHLLRQGFRFGYWGTRGDGPWVEHIGTMRKGKGY